MEGRFRLVWQSVRSPQDFATTPVAVGLDSSWQIRATFAPEGTSDRGGDRGLLPLRTRYDGTLPANLISRDGNRFVLALGQLPISACDLVPGVRIEVELTATRSFAGRSAKQKLEKRDEIRG